MKSSTLPVDPPPWMIEGFGGTRKTDEVAAIVASCLGYTLADFQAKSRRQPLAWMRQVAMVLTSEMSGASSLAVGIVFWRDHANVMYAEQRVKDACDAYPKVRDKVHAARERIRMELEKQDLTAAPSTVL